MDPITIIAGINGAMTLVAALVRMAEIAKEKGEITPEALVRVRMAARLSDAEVDRLVAEEKARLGKPVTP